MEVVVPLAVVWVLVSAHNATRPDVPAADDDDPRLHDYYDEERINISETGMYLGSPCAQWCNPKLVHVVCEPSTRTCQCDSKHSVALGVAKGCAKQTGMYLGSPCAQWCNPKLVHVVCEPSTRTCQCDSKHPVALGVAKGCAKPRKLGEQCFYRQTCRAFDAHSSCVQVNHNAYCQCDPGYHSTSHSRPTQRIFCTEDLVLLTADMPTLLGVASGIFVLAGLLCMVLHLYTRARYHPTHLADARLTPPCLYSLNDTGGTISGTRASSRASSRSGCTSGTLELESSTSRRASRRGVPVSASRAGAARTAAILLISRHLKAVRRDGGAHPPKCAAKGSRRPSLSSVQSSSSSIRSYSAKKWEREREQKERRQMSMRLAQLHDKMAAGREIPKHAPTPSPRSPNNSTDGLLPAVCEIRELVTNPEPQLQGVDGPCSSSSLY